MKAASTAKGIAFLSAICELKIGFCFEKLVQQSMYLLMVRSLCMMSFWAGSVFIGTQASSGLGFSLVKSTPFSTDLFSLTMGLPWCSSIFWCHRLQELVYFYSHPSTANLLQVIEGTKNIREVYLTSIENDANLCQTLFVRTVSTSCLTSLQWAQ